MKSSKRAMMSKIEVKSYSPRDGSVVEIIGHESDHSEVEEICLAAESVFGAFRAVSLDIRAKLLNRIADSLEADREALVALADRESALGVDRLNGELSRTSNQLRLFSSVISESGFLEAIVDHGDSASTPPIPDIRRQLIPIGPVAVFGSSNFPFAFSVIGGDSASSLAAGCPVVVKAHSAHPALSARVSELVKRSLAEMGLDPRIFGVVYGREAGKLLVQSPHIRAVGFTGSEYGGRALMDLAAQRPDPIPVYAEMGSLNPLIVSHAKTKDLQPMVEGIAGSVLLGHGQFCTKPGLVFVPKGDDGDRLVAALADRLKQADPAYMLSEGIRESFLSNIQGLGRLSGVDSLVHAEKINENGTLTTTGLVQTSAEFAVQEPSVMVECFGPAALVIRYEDTIDLLKVLAAVPGSLTLSLHVADNEESMAREIIAVAEQRVGRIILNGYPTGVVVNWAQQHGGPYPASSNSLYTSVGATAIRRFLRPVAYQNFPDSWLPTTLQDSNPLGIGRRIDGVAHSGAIVTN